MRPCTRGMSSVALAVLLVGLVTAPGAASVATHEEASIGIDPSSGPPTTRIMVVGAGFGENEKVVVRFGHTRIASTTTDGAGSLSKAARVPATASPGKHTIEAVGKVSGLSATATFLVRTNWSMFHMNPRHSGFDRYENVLNVANVPDLQVRWGRYFGGGKGFSSAPVVVDGVVYQTWKNEVLAVDARSGIKRWMTTTPARNGTVPAIADGVVYVGSDDGRIHALRTSDGSNLWTFSTGGRVLSSASVVNGVVFDASSSGVVFALKAATGVKVWSFDTGAEISSSPAVAGGVVYVGSEDGSLYALHATTGAKLWSYATGDAIVSSPAVAKGVVFVGSQDGSLYALDAATGEKIWSFATPYRFEASSPAVADGVVYVGNAGGLYAVDAVTGAQLWGNSTMAVSASSPAVADGVVYLESDQGELLALDAASGARLWSYGADTGGSSPAIADGVVYMSVNPGIFVFGLP